MKFNKSIGAFIMLVLFLVPGSSCAAPDSIAAIVNKDIITLKELNDYAAFTGMQEQGARVKSRQELLAKLIEDRLILQEARRSGLKADEARVKARVEDIKSKYPSEAVFQQTLLEQGLVQSDLEEKISEQMLMYEVINKQVKSRVTVDPQEITSYFEEDKKLFELPEQRSVEYIVTREEDKAAKFYAALKDAKGFGEAAAAAGVTPGTLQLFKNGQFKKNIEDVVFSLKTGEFSYPLKAENEFYVFRVTGVVEPRRQKLDEVREEIRDILFTRKFQEGLASWLDKLKAKAYIKINVVE
ncbi:MAG: peptidyl-prolyl cis-trans isomerase [Candidatus Omnitrophota bacterium]|jgi:parvulin-like peptidyl-prolyl isomerase